MRKILFPVILGIFAIGLFAVPGAFADPIELDKALYNWTDIVYITITIPSHNLDSAAVETIGTADLPIQVITRVGKMCPTGDKTYKAVETGPDTGIFTAQVKLTGFDHTLSSMTTAYSAVATSCGTGNTDGKIKTLQQTDGISVSYEYIDGVVVVASASVSWNIGEASFDSTTISIGDPATFTVVDPDENLDSAIIDAFTVGVYSNSDQGGLPLAMTETGVDTGIFTGVFITTTDITGSKLHVSDGDTVTAEYNDMTLPEPYLQSDSLTISRIMIVGTIPFERAPAANPRVVDAFGSSISEVSVDQQVQIATDVSNGQDVDQPFAYLVQMRDSYNVPVSVAWITGSLTAGQSMSPALSWTPDRGGTFTATAFVWESVDNPIPLSAPVSTTFDVVEDWVFVITEPSSGCGEGTVLTEGVCHIPSPDSVGVDSHVYDYGNEITISGNFANYNGMSHITILVFGPDNNIKTINQIVPDSSGSFSTDEIAAGMFSLSGTYTVKAYLGDNVLQTTFLFGGAPAAEPEMEIPEITSFTTYTDPQFRYTIDVPSGWVQSYYDAATGMIDFEDHTDDPNVDFDVHGGIYIWYGEGLGTSKQGQLHSVNLESIEDEYAAFCSDPPEEADDPICYNYQLLGSEVVPSALGADKIRTKYTIGESWTLEWPDGTTKDRFGTVVQFIDGDDVWEIITWMDEEYKDAYGEGVVLSSFSFLAAYTVTNAPGSSTPGCEPNCFLPSTVTIPVGGTVNWENDDTAAHTTTSGTSSGGLSGHWDSGLMMAGSSPYSVTFTDEGTYHYYCMVHPWMQGTIVVGDGTPLRTAQPGEEPIPEITSFTTYTDPQGRFTIDVPSGWDRIYYYAEDGDADWADSADEDNMHGKIGLWYNQGYAATWLSQSTDSANLELLKDEYRDWCDTTTFEQDGVICYNYQIVTSAIGPFSDAADQSRKMYMIIDSWTVEFPDGSTQDRAGSVLQVIDGPDVWDIYSWVDGEYADEYLAPLAQASITFMAASPQSSLVVDTNKSSYTYGESISIVGFVDGYDSSDPMKNMDVNIMIWEPSGDLVAVAQVPPSSSGQFSTTMMAGGMISDPGTYTVRAGWGAQQDETSFQFVGATLSSVTVTNAPGSATPGCEENDECFIPNIVTILPGGTVTWENTDNAAHTATSGDSGDGPSGVFDSSLIMAGGSYSVTLDSEGTFDYFCMVHPWMSGTVVVGDGGSVEAEQQDEEPVVVCDSGIVIDGVCQIEVSQPELNAYVGQNEYDVGDEITVNVGLINTESDEMVIIDVLDPAGNPVVTRAVTVSPGDNESIGFRISDNFLTGSYTVVASSTIDGNTITDITFFKLKSLYNQFQISSVEVTDQQGNPSTLSKGTLGYIKVSLTSDANITALVTVNLFDADLLTLGVGSVRSTIGEGESEIILSFLIPDDAASGDAEIFVNGFTDWISSGGIPLTNEFSITGEITQ